MRTPLLLALCLPAWADTTHHVPVEFATIQAAIDAAGPGDTVLVAPGTYVETLQVAFKDDITLRSEQGPHATTIEADIFQTCIRCTAGSSGTIEGFRITNGFGFSGGGISIFQSTFDVTNCVLEGNASETSGAGIMVRDSVATISHCVIQGNGAWEEAGGILIDGSPVTVSNCVIRDNWTDIWDGGGLSILPGSEGTRILNCTIVDNDASFYGDGIVTWADDVLIANCIVKNNQGVDIEELGPPTTIVHTNYNGSDGTSGNIDVDPLFLDLAGGDVHLSFNSPCRGAGRANIPGLPPVDLDGNPRGDSVDMGADQYGPACYLMGDAIPGSTVTVRCGGVDPGDGMQMWVDVGLRSTPIQTGFGDWWLDVRRIEVLAGQASADGWHSTSWIVPPAAPTGPLYGQAIAGPQFTPYWSGWIQ